jgi:formate dehydrogenase major subunit
MTNRHDEKALHALDQLLQDRPDKDGHHFSEASRCLVGWRDALLRPDHQPGDRQLLAQVNAALSVVLGGQFPLGRIPWSQIEAARDQLRRLSGLGEVAVQPLMPAGNSSHSTRS